MKLILRFKKKCLVEMDARYRSRAYKKTALCGICLCLGIMALKMIYFNENKEESAMLRNRIAALEKLLESKNNLQSHLTLNDRDIPAQRILGREINMTAARHRMTEQVTVLMFSFNEESSCLKSRIENVLREYPNIRLIVSSSAVYGNPASHQIEYLSGVQKEGGALSTMVPKVKSPYFLYLSSGVQLPPQDSAISVTWLLHALEKIPELDFIGGSFLRHDTHERYPVLEVPCHRLRMCNWTLSQTFEYRYSVDDMMVCQETSSSFMGRTDSLSKVGQFDPNLDAMATTDFFLRAKGKAVTGLRPEVQFKVLKRCFPSPLSVRQEADLKFAFMKKHQLFIVRDSFKREVKAVDSKDYNSLNDYNIVFWTAGTYANPLYARGLLFNLEVAADYLEANNISYFLDSGFPLGGIKTGGVLPWDRDVDLGFFAEWKEVHNGLMQHCKARGITADIKIKPIAEDRKEIFLRAAGDFGYNTMYQQPENAEEEHMLMFVYIHGRKYPVKTYLFESFRVFYGLTYLEMHGSNGRLNCQVKGHHACVPLQFQYGGGHWRDFYCEL